MPTPPATILLIGSITAFVGLFIRDFLIRGLGLNPAWKLRSPRTGPAYATIPGAISVLAVAVIRVWPTTISSTAGWWMLVTLAGFGTVLGLWLTVVIFVAAFEHEQFQAEDISGIWFIPETVESIGSDHLANDLVASSFAARNRQPCWVRDARPQVPEGDTSCEVASGWREDVTPVKGSADL